MEQRTLPRLAPSLGILTGYWAYVTVSNILYAHSMAISIALVTTENVYASWGVRVLQHAFLYPVFVACCFASLRLGWTPLWRRVPIQLLLAIVVAVLAQPFLSAAEIATGKMTFHEMHGQAMNGQWFTASDIAIWIASATSFLLSYGFGVALITGFAIYRRFRDSELRVTDLEREWSSARLSALRMQLSPHTLFNLLNTIRGNISWDPAGAQSMIVQLADLLRRLLNASEREFSQLADEIRFTGLYLELQQKRFADRLRIMLPDRDQLPAAWVPSLILQPLVENAVVHGLAGHQELTEISVQAIAGGETLILRVLNTTAGNRPEPNDGIGLRNVRDRLAVHFGARATFVSQAIEGGKWAAEIRIPLVTDAPAASAPVSRPASALTSTQ
jgi:Histidine kinase